ncbi:MAG: serine hydroxymethyltransferase [Clostridia bacterium]|nr:serine hydroxymethyltransferase [Clostridia bacterium]
MEYLNKLESFDKEVFDACNLELQRQQHNIELIASENIVSEGVLFAAGSVLTNKYAEGYPGHRYYGGCQYVDIVENIARERAKKVFGAEYANVQPHSGANANLAAFCAMVKPGDTIMGMDLASGGHLSHGTKFNISGKHFNAVGYSVDPTTSRLDYDNILAIAKECQPRMIVFGASAYPRAIDFKRCREVCDEVGAYMMVDMAHIAGLVAAGCHESPVPYADIVTTTTHKTMRGPRGGLILCKEEYGKQVDKAVFPGTQGGPLMHIIAAKAVMLGEALKPEYKTYQQQIVKNASVLANALIDNGFRLLTGGTDNHLMLMDLRTSGITGQELEKRLDAVHITVNKNAIPRDPQPSSITSGIRIGTPAVTARGFKEDEMLMIAKWIRGVVDDFEGNQERISKEVQELCAKYPIYEH